MGWLAALGLGLGVGAISGVLGIGGGIMLVPGLMLFAGFSQQKAQGTSLAALVPPVGALAAWQYYRMGYVDLSAALWIGAGFAAGAFATAGLVRYIPTAVLSLLFGSLLIALGVRLIFSNDQPARVAAIALCVWLAAMAAWLLLRALGRAYHVPHFEDAMRRQMDEPVRADFQI